MTSAQSFGLTIARLPLMLNDPSPHRTVACPVHFLWDGRGRGRALVRAGFLGFLLAAMCFTLGTMTRIAAVETAGVVVLSLAALSWGVGQLLTLVVARQMKREMAQRRAAA